MSEQHMPPGPRGTANQSWDGPFRCDGCDAGPGETHIHCDGPTDGERVGFRRKRDHESRTADVKIHWHYEGCMIDVGDGGLALCPELGDVVWAIGDDPR